MAIELAEKYLPYVDEIFTKESKKELVTNQDFSFEGGHSVKIYKISTKEMNDYGRSFVNEQKYWSHYGRVEALDATTERFVLGRDRSFTFAIDTLDEDETGGALEASSALARQVREIIIPEVDSWVYEKMCTGAGTKPEAVNLTSGNIYNEIIKANNTLDNEHVLEAGRVLVVTPDVYMLMKQCKDIVMETDIGNDMRLKGVIANLDGLNVQRVPASRLPDGFGFMVAHPCATVSPTKLESYNIHHNPPGINGDLVEGRIVYDAFVMENKAKAIYYQTIPSQKRTKEELEKMTVDQIRRVAKQRGYTITKTTKAEIITEFLAAQETQTTPTNPPEGTQ